MGGINANKIMMTVPTPKMNALIPMTPLITGDATMDLSKNKFTNPPKKQIRVMQALNELNNEYIVRIIPNPCPFYNSSSDQASVSLVHWRVRIV
ncbi:MAG: hypothetical protein IPN15_03865 [Saprospiraceae bacterium]|nr:hypothetical protein [Candidatus Vicinibacter affinis]